jgi:membrane protease YdiL (CAAX protease family)
MGSGESIVQGDGPAGRKIAWRPAQFFLIAFLITWTCEFSAAYFSYRDGMQGLQDLFLLLGILGPFLATLVMFRWTGNSRLWKDYLDRIVNTRRIRPSDLPVMLFLFPVVIVLGVLVSLAFGQSASQLALTLDFGFSAGFMPVILILIYAPSFEELGWRGYGMDSLRSGRTLFSATLVFAVLWALWHLPLFFINNYYHHQLLSNGLYFANFWISVIPMAFLINWLYYRNNRSVIACFLIHLSADISMSVFALEQFTKCIVTVLLLIGAAAIVLADKKFFFDREPYPDPV